MNQRRFDEDSDSVERFSENKKLTYSKYKQRGKKKPDDKEGKLSSLRKPKLSRMEANDE